MVWLRGTQGEFTEPRHLSACRRSRGAAGPSQSVSYRAAPIGSVTRPGIVELAMVLFTSASGLVRVRQHVGGTWR